MKIGTIVSINRKMIAAMNSCDQQTQIQVIENSIMSLPEEDIKKVFTKRYFIWNIVRGKDFYKVMSRYITEKLKAAKQLESKVDEFAETYRAIRLYYIIVDTAANDAIAKAFTKTIMKLTPFITVASVKLSSSERIRQLLAGDLDDIPIEECLVPFIDAIKERQEHINLLEMLFNDQLIT